MTSTTEQWYGQQGSYYTMTDAYPGYTGSAGKKSELDTSVPMSKGKTDKHPEMQLMQSCKCA